MALCLPGPPKTANDTAIAATGLLTKNTREFDRVQGLTLLDWMKS